MNEIISVIIPVFNGANTLERCINSVLSSNYLDIEVIIIDDGSTDNSWEICVSFAKIDSRISIYHFKNNGVSHARNIGISYARGKYCAFVDCDDYVPSNYFMNLYNNMKKNHSELALGSVAYIYKDKTVYVYAGKGIISFGDKSEQNRVRFLELNQKYLLYGPYNKLYLTKYIKKHDVKFPIEMSYGEDLMFNLSYMSHCNSISCNNEPIYCYYCSNELSLSKKYRSNLFETGLKLNLSLRVFFEKQGFWTKSEKKYIYERVFDDAYNAIFGLWNPKCNYSLKLKVSKISSILNNEEVVKCYDIANVAGYSKIDVFFMKNKMVFSLVLLHELRRLFCL